MRASLTSFLNGLADLREYIAGLELESALWGHSVGNDDLSETEEQVKRVQDHIGQGISKRQFEYNSIIVSLYGFLEQFIESVLRAYIVSLSSVIPRYSDLPKPIQKNHLDLSLALLSRVKQDRYKGAITTGSVIANLNSCLVDSDSYKVNADAFSIHTANFRADTIDESFTRAGILQVSQRIRYFPPFSDYVEKSFPDRKSATISQNELYFLIDDLAERRNEVSHGSASEILSNNLLLQYVEFLEAYCAGLFELLHCAELGDEVTCRGKALGVPLAVFDKRIVCFESKGLPIRLGDVLVAETGHAIRPFIGGEILELQIDHRSYQQIPKGDSVAVAMRVAFKAKENYTFHLLPQRSSSSKPDQQVPEDVYPLVSEE